MARASPTPTGIRLYLFGPFHLESDTGSIDLPTRKVKALLAYLVLHPRAHSREKLAGLCWAESPEHQARTSLRQALAMIRQNLGAEILVVDRVQVQINPAFRLWVDALEFEKVTSESLITRHLSLYRGDLLSDFYDDWILAERERYRTLYLDTLLHLVQTFRSASEYERAIEFAEKIVATDRANEHAYHHLMFCYATNGNRAAALEAYERCRRALRDELDVEPEPETETLYHWIKQTSASRRSRESQITNLPIPLTSFIGRKHERAQVKHYLCPFSSSSPDRSGGRAVRLLTLSGVGGTGKTRLAIQVASELVDRFADGIWWVGLESLSDPALVPHAVAKTFGVREAPHQPLTDAIADHLGNKQLLLVIDNCEHLVVACAQLAAALLSHCPNLQILATSREALNISGEIVFPVPPLALPRPWQLLSGEAGILAVLPHYEGIDLFIERAVAVRPDFTLTEQNARAVAQVCTRLDGIPLAIELAAARIKVLSVEQIAERLDNRFSLLTDGDRTALPRHQTLRAAIDWSYDLLSEPERILLRRVSVFAAGFTLEAVEAVASELKIENEKLRNGHNIRQSSIAQRAPDSQFSILNSLAALVDKSLVVVDLDGEQARYRLLETIRQYGQEKLHLSGEERVICHAHLDWWTKLAEQAEPEFLGTRQAEWLDRLELEHDNIRAALRWSLEAGELETGLRLAAGVWRFWLLRGHLSEGRRWMQRLLEHAGGSGSLRARVLRGQAGLALAQGDYDGAWRLYEDALALFREENHHAGIMLTLGNLGSLAWMHGNYTAARSFAEQSLTLSRELGEQTGVAYGLLSLGSVAWAQGDYVEARPLLEEAQLRFEALGNKQYIAYALFGLGSVAWCENENASARALFRRGLTIALDIGDKWGIANALETLAYHLATDAHAQRAASILAAVERLREAISAPLPTFGALHDRTIGAVQVALDEATIAAARAQGQAMTLEQAIEYALAEV